MLVPAILCVVGATAIAASNVLRPDVIVDWTRYHNSDEAVGLLKQLSTAFPDLTKLTSIGKSYQGKDLWVLELTNRKVKSPEEKPGYYVDGGIHAGEFTGSEQVLYLAWYLCVNYGKNPEVTRLVDTRTLYLRPKFNPDGSDYALTHPDGLRSTVRPWDDDEDGLLDEDKAEDLDGDGAITQMRVASPLGTHKISTEDPRIMLPRQVGETGGQYYVLVSEGTDNDGDGQFNEDGVGGIDMNRNFPRTWELPFIQDGAGRYPLSEPETRAALEFLVAHPNITGIVHNHTSGGFMYRLPSTDPPEAHEPGDLELVRIFGERFTAVTGQPVRDSYTSPRQHRYGTLITWSYFDFGVIGWVPEHWGGFGRDYDGDRQVTERERLRWNDEELGGAGFTAWKAYDHLQLGKVEIGGWKREFTQQNPPGKFLEQEIAMKVPWLIYVASASPLIRIADAKATSLAAGLFRIDATVQNDGYLPTNVTDRAIKARLAKPVRATLRLKAAELAGDGMAVDLGHIPGTRALLGGDGPHVNRRTASWIVKATGPGAEAELTVVSEKGGTERTTIALK